MGSFFIYKCTYIHVGDSPSLKDKANNVPFGQHSHQVCSHLSGPSWLN